MQLRQEYTVNNTAYKNEIFISEKDNVDIYKLIFHFFNCPMPAQNIKNICIIPAPTDYVDIEEKGSAKEEDIETLSDMFKKMNQSPTIEETENNSTDISIPVEHEEKETDINVNVKETPSETTHGYYVKFLLNNKLIKKWASWKTEKKAKDSIYNLAYRQRKEKGYNIKCEILEIQPMTLEEFNKIN